MDFRGLNLEPNFGSKMWSDFRVYPPFFIFIFLFVWVGGGAPMLSMCASHTKSGSRVNAVGEEHQQIWHMLNAHRCELLGK